VTAISDLEIFARVARTGNMSAAGREMGLSPAVVSKRISQLEDRLGARLFQRTTRHLTLTETGAGYFKRVVDILSLCEEAEDFVSRRNTKPRGLLKVTMPTAFSRLHIAPYIDDFLARYPEIELDVHIVDAFVDIIREGFDLAIRIGELEDSSLVARRIAPDTRVICAAPAYLDKHGTPTDLADLEAHNCLTAGTVEVWRLDGRHGDTQIHPHGNVRSDSGEFIRELVLAGVGVGLLSTWDIGPALHSGALRVVLPEYRGASNAAVHAVYPSREFMPAKVNVLIEFLAELYGTHPYWDKDLDLNKMSATRHPTRAASRRLAKGSSPAVATR
jgi:DNA-binding transcriptional LysR family regulator